jgi:hypothetical protein
MMIWTSLEKQASPSHLAQAQEKNTTIKAETTIAEARETSQRVLARGKTRTRMVIGKRRCEKPLVTTTCGRTV